MSLGSNNWQKFNHVNARISSWVSVFKFKFHVTYQSYLITRLYDVEAILLKVSVVESGGVLEKVTVFCVFFPVKRWSFKIIEDALVPKKYDRDDFGFPSWSVTIDDVHLTSEFWPFMPRVLADKCSTSLSLLNSSNQKTKIKTCINYYHPLAQHSTAMYLIKPSS